MTNTASLDFALAEMKARAEAQDRQVTTLDTKATFVLTSASVLIAGVTTVQKFLPATAQPTAFHAIVFYGGATVALGLYVQVVNATIKAYTPRTFKRAPDPPALEERLAHPEADTKRAVFIGMVQAFATNAKLVETKAQQTQTALNWLRWMAIWLAIWLFALTGVQFI